MHLVVPRILAVSCVSALALGACLDPASGTRVESAPAATVAITLPAFGIGPACFDFEVRRDAPGAPVFSGIGDRNRVSADMADARRGGAICADAGDHAVTVVVPCDPAAPRNTATLWVQGIYMADGQPQTALENPCPPGADASGCERAFDCKAGVEASVSFDFHDVHMLHEAARGYFALGINAQLPAGVRDVCYDIRVSDGSSSSTVIWAKGNPTEAPTWPGDDGGDGSVCSSLYGNGPGGDVSYIGPCNALAPDHTVSVWVHDVVFDDAIPAAERNWANPCPASARGGSAWAWTGGCQVAARCAENHDLTIDFALDLRPGSTR